MKNIHLIPTDKPSRLALLHDDKLHIGTSWKKDFNVNPQNIYITSDEDLKAGDWTYNIVSKTIFTAKQELIDLINHPNVTLTTNKKIILTTDQDLIKDGVQAIDDEFLEWFVKNPSCEEVEVEKDEFYSKKAFIEGKDAITFKYEIIIPKEEPKQDTVGKEFYESADKTITVYRQETLEEAKQEQKQHLIDLMRLDEQETLEEVSPMNDLLIDLKETKISVKESIDIIEDEFMRTQINIFVQKALDSVIDRIENELLETESKWQQEQDKNKYSEEEVYNIVEQAIKNYGKKQLGFFDGGISNPIYYNLKKWFEQFKKK